MVVYYVKKVFAFTPLLRFCKKFFSIKNYFIHSVQELLLNIALINCTHIRL
jgi:hypothetical protein